MKNTALIFVVFLSFVFQGSYAQTSMEDIEKANRIFADGVKMGVNRDFEEALLLFNEAIEIYPLYAEAFLYRGLAKTELKKYDEAIKDFNISIEIDPGYSDQAYYFRGLARYLKGDYEGAISDLSLAIRLEPDYASFFQRGRCNFELGEFQVALKDFEIALRLEPEFKQGILYRGKALVETRLYEEGLKDLKKAADFFPDEARVYYYKALAYRQTGNKSASRRNLRKASAINPALADAFAMHHENHQKDPQSIQAGSTTRETPVYRESLTETETSTLSDAFSRKDREETDESPPQADKESLSIASGDLQNLASGFYTEEFQPVSPKGFGVQLASYHNTDNLSRLATAYEEEYGHPVFINVSKVNGRRLYKLIIGSFPHREGAENLRDEMRNKGFADSFLVIFERMN